MILKGGLVSNLTNQKCACKRVCLLLASPHCAVDMFIEPQIAIELFFDDLFKNVYNSEEMNQLHPTIIGGHLLNCL